MENKPSMLSKIKAKMNFKVGLLIVVVFLALLSGLFIALLIFNKQQRQEDNRFEVTFLDPRQAIVFWTTTNETIGFVKYGSSENDLSQTAEQTSSVPGKIHAVLLTDIPTEGLYLSLHTDDESRFLWPEVKKINFDPTTIE
jgi:flagellar basal body-associated protein FliL